MTIPTFSAYEHKIVYENPQCIIDGIVLHKEATIEINTKHITDEFLHRLMYHMGEGHIQIKIARKKEEAKPKHVQVSPLEFVEMVMEKEHLVGNPIFWAEWPNKEKNT